MTSPPTELDELVVSRGEITIVRINRPERANAVTPALMNALREVFEQVVSDGATRAVVLTGTGRFFCAGADLKDQRAQLEQRGQEAFVDYLCDEWMPAVQRAMAAIWHAPIPVVAAINGAATAGGFDLALCCDYRVAAEGAVVGSTYIELGIVPVGAGAYLLPRLVGMGKALQLMALGRRLTAVDAATIGVIDEVVATPDELLEVATTTATSLAAAPGGAYAATKRLVHELSAPGFDEHHQRVRHENVTLFHDSRVQHRLFETIAARSKP